MRFLIAAALLIAAPVFSLRALSLRIRILFALCLTWMVYPLHEWPIIDPISAQGLVEILNQVMIGLVMGLVLQIVTAAILLAGQSISNAVGLSMATMIDPNVGNVPVIGQFLIVMSTLIFVGVGGHGLLLGLILDSFNSMPIGKNLMGQDVWGQLVAWSSMLFLGGLLTALPVMVTLLFINVGLGVATRAAPSLNVFSLGLPALMVAGYLIMIFSLPSIGARIQWLWLQSLAQTRSLVGLP